MKNRILYYAVLVAQIQAINLKIVLISALIFNICALEKTYGQSVRNGSYVDLEDSHYSSLERHKNFKWYHLNRLTTKDDSVWVKQDPIEIHKQDTIWSSSDGAFYYFEGRITTNGNHITHNALEEPSSAFEKIVSKLDKKLQKLRKEYQDLANPSNWLVIATDKDIREIDMRWKLPEKYRLFLQNFSPLNVSIESRKFVNGLLLYGANNLIENQDGYSFDTVTQTTLTDSPENFVVIADDGLDPYCIDINAIKDGDAPVYTSMHGEGTWNFEKFADNFESFIRTLAG